MSQPSVTICLTAYNESTLLEGAVDDILRVMETQRIPYSILIVNDGSRDWSQSLETRLLLKKSVRVKNIYPNGGKGAALSSIFPDIESDFLVLIDADQEYHASDIPGILEPLVKNHADWVQGSRYNFGRKRPKQYLATYLVNRFINGWLFFLSGRVFHDILCGLYGFRTILVKEIQLNEKRFSYTGEFVWRLLGQNARIAEVPVAYTFRTYESGKKIKWWETFTLLYCLAKYKFAMKPRRTS